MSDFEAQACPEYMMLSRRRFVATTGAAAVVASAPAWLPRVAVARNYCAAAQDVVISVFLRGASDGLSVCTPFTETAYYNARPNLAIPRPDSGQPLRGIALPNSDVPGPNGTTTFAFAPALAPLMQAYNNGHLLVVHATGSTDGTRSHFDAQKYMEIGKPGDTSLFTGWLGRHLYSIDPMNPNAILRAVGIGDGLSRTLVGSPLSLPIPDLASFGLTGNAATRPNRVSALGDMYNAVADPLNAAADTTIATMDLLSQINFTGYQPAGGAVYPTSNFGNSLKSTAALIKAQVGVEAISIDLNGWDTHSNQGPTSGAMNTVMTTLANAVAAFYTDMTSGSPLPPTFTLVVMSEFGRRVAENGSLGTDHGHGNMMMVLGQNVNGRRVLTQWPGLQPGQLYQGIDLQVTIDFRDILAEIVQRRLGNTNLPYVFPGYTPTFRGVFA
jgi:uncharacterized protein (DUF1501 family)